MQPWQLCWPAGLPTCRTCFFARRSHETEKRHGGGAHNWGEEGKE